MVTAPEAEDFSSSAGTTPSKQAPTPACVSKAQRRHEPADLTKIVKAIDRCCEGLDSVDSIRIAMKTIGGLVDGTNCAPWTSCLFRPLRHSWPMSHNTPLGGSSFEQLQPKRSLTRTSGLSLSQLSGAMSSALSMTPFVIS